jgi:hypothetical protein
MIIKIDQYDTLSNLPCHSSSLPTQKDFVAFIYLLRKRE